MAVLEHVFDGTRENFPQLVVENSRKGTVLVNYWAPNAGPCLRLWQVLENLSREYRGRFLLVNINTQTQSALARHNSITSVPTVKIYRNGEIVESIYGAQSESSLRCTIDKYVQPTQNSAIAQAIRKYQAGEVDEALALLAEASGKAPDDIKLYATAIKILLREKRYTDIEAYVSGLPVHVQNQREVDILRIHARMLSLAAQAPAVDILDQRCTDVPGDLANLMQCAAVAMVQDQYAKALEILLQVLRQDPIYSDELPRKAILVIFSLLGDSHELTRLYQKQLRELLH